MGQAKTGIAALVKRYAAVVIFPTLAATSIFADLRHTQQWKKRLAEANQTSLSTH